MTSPRDMSAASYAVPPQPPRPTVPGFAYEPAPGFAYEPARPLASGPRVTFGILLALASGFVGCGWLAFTGLLLAYPGSAQASFWVALGMVGLVIALSGVGGIGTAVTARRPITDRWVRCWVWMSCVFGGLGAAFAVAVLVYLQASGA